MGAPGSRLTMTGIEAISGDITTVAVDAIVNAANSRLAGGGGVDGAIHRAGGPVIAAQCRAWVVENGHLPTGRAMVTDAGDLPAALVIHTVGPVWDEHTPERANELLSDCYRNSLELARQRGCSSVAFPNISTGVYGFPKGPAAEVATRTVRRALTDSEPVKNVVFVCFDEENLALYQELLAD